MDSLCCWCTILLVKVVQAMYVGVRSRIHVNSTFIEEFEVKVAMHHGSVLGPLLFTNRKHFHGNFV